MEIKEQPKKGKNFIEQTNYQIVMLKLSWIYLLV